MVTCLDCRYSNILLPSWGPERPQRSWSVQLGIHPNHLRGCMHSKPPMRVFRYWWWRVLLELNASRLSRRWLTRCKRISHILPTRRWRRCATVSNNPHSPDSRPIDTQLCTLQMTMHMSNSSCVLAASTAEPTAAPTKG